MKKKSKKAKNLKKLMGSAEFKSSKWKYVFLALTAALVAGGIASFYQSYLHESYAGEEPTKNKIMHNTQEEQTGLEGFAMQREYYGMFQCSCCGAPVDAECCASAKQRKAYVDLLLLEGIRGEELAYRMVKRFGFDVLRNQSAEEKIRAYIRNKAPPHPPRIEIENPRHDFGRVSQADGIVSSVFTIKNAGGSDLIIENMDTSCMCTYASIIYKGREGPKFGMSIHGNNPANYSLTIPPGESALLKVYYDPMAHGKQKKREIRVTREITIISNDPVDFQKKVRIEATQVP
jgi:hypothetical protein